MTAELHRRLGHIPVQSDKGRDPCDCDMQWTPPGVPWSIQTTQIAQYILLSSVKPLSQIEPETLPGFNRPAGQRKVVARISYMEKVTCLCIKLDTKLQLMVLQYVTPLMFLQFAIQIRVNVFLILFFVSHIVFLIIL